MTTSTRGTRRLRTAIAAALAAVGLLALAGCMKVDMDLTLSEDDTVSGTVVMAVSNEVADLMGSEAMKGLGDLGDLPEGATQEPYSDDDYTGTQITFADAPVDTFSGQDGEQLSITRHGDEYVVDGQLDLTPSDAEPDLPTKITDSFQASVAITFPGEVTESNGTVDGNTVTWSPKYGQKNELHAVGSAEAGSAFPWWLVGLVVGVLVIAVVVVLVVRANNRSRSAAAAAAGGAAAPSPHDQVFGAQQAAAPSPSTGPVPEPLEPEPLEPEAPESPAQEPAAPSTGPVAEPLEPEEHDAPAAPGAGDDGPEGGAPRRTDPPQGA